MFVREDIIDEILPFIDKPFIKIITGIRRCGKSTLLLQLKDKLLKDYSVKEEHILFINFENLEFSDLYNSEELKKLLIGKITEKTKYIFFDEIQNINGWERIVNGLFAENKYDIYITGSNSNLLSSEISTLLTGRSLQFNLQPFTFKEFVSFRNKNQEFDIKTEFDKFLKHGGFPAVVSESYTDYESKHIISDIFDAAVLRDTIGRKKIRNVDLFNRLLSFIISNIGFTFSANSIFNYFKNQNRKTNIETIYSYLLYLQEAFIISKVRRFELIGKLILKTEEKYYLGDHSLLFAKVDNLTPFINGILENIVFNELMYRRNVVYIGKIFDKEIDFVSVKKESISYYQVSYLMSEDSTFEREISSLRSEPSNNDKTILTLDKTRLGNYDGIRVKYLPDWLLDK